MVAYSCTLPAWILTPFSGAHFKPLLRVSPRSSWSDNTVDVFMGKVKLLRRLTDIKLYIVRKGL